LMGFFIFKGTSKLLYFLLQLCLYSNFSNSSLVFGDCYSIPFQLNHFKFLTEQ
jgi:hypothetical protein